LRERAAQQTTGEVTMTKSIRAIYTTNLGVKKGEKVLVFTDRVLRSELLESQELCRRQRLRDIAHLTAEVGKSFTKNMTYFEYDATGSHGAEPPAELWARAFGEAAVAAMKEGGVLDPLLRKEASEDDLRKAEALVKRYARSSVAVVIGLSNYSTSHTRFRDLLTRVCGARYASMPIFDASMLEGSMNVDWKALALRTRAVARRVNRAELLEISTPNGTRLAVSKRGRKALADTGILTAKGSFGNLPAGEAFFAPLEGTAEGRLVLEWAPLRELASPVTLTVSKGRAVEIEGREPFVERLRERLDARVENRNIAEIGIGTNDRAKRPDNILESEKILGTVHVALGDNSSFGGTVKTPFHQDFVFFRPTVMLTLRDGSKDCLLRDGSLMAQEEGPSGT
jgi:leucyl aminopeptidase (aminopeptidase T)